MQIQHPKSPRLILERQHNPIHVIGGKGEKVFPVCRANPELVERIIQLASTGITVHGVQSLPYIAIDRLCFTYSFILPIKREEFQHCLSSHSGDKRKLIRHLAALLSGNSRTDTPSLLNGSWKQLHDDDAVFDEHQNITARQTACSINHHKKKRKILAEKRFPIPFQDVTGNDFVGELPVQLHLPGKGDRKAYHIISIEQQEGAGDVFLKYTVYFSGNPQRALRHHPFLSKESLAPQECVRSFFQAYHAKEETDNYLDDDQTSQQAVLNALTNTLQAFLALHYADLRRAIHKVDNLMESIDMPEDWIDCPSTATIRSLEVDWHFRVQSATWFVHQLGLNIRPEIRAERFKFSDFEEDRKDDTKYSFEYFHDKFNAYPRKGVEISGYVKISTLSRLEVRLKYHDGVSSDDGDVRISGVSSSVYASSYPDLLNRILRGILVAHDRISMYLPATNRGYEYTDAKYRTEQSEQWTKEFLQYAIANNAIFEGVEIITCVRAGFIPTSKILSPEALKFIRSQPVSGERGKRKIPAFFKQKGKNDKGSILRFYPVIPEQ